MFEVAFMLSPNPSSNMDSWWLVLYYNVLKFVENLNFLTLKLKAVFSLVDIANGGSFVFIGRF